MLEGRNIQSVDNLDVDLLGFIFYDKSPRHVIQFPSYMPAKRKRVGVFVNSSIEDVSSRVDEYSLSYVQLHGEESVEYIASLRCHIPSTTQIIKSIAISSNSDIFLTENYSSCVDLFLFENRCVGYGGSGKKFDWSYLSSYRGPRPFLLSGGIGPEDISHLATIRHPYLYGIDLNSRFELSPGLKDIFLLQTFINQLRNEQNKQTLHVEA